MMAHLEDALSRLEASGVGMKICAVIPAAGRGSRLGLDIPKILVPINEQHRIWNILEDLLEPVVDHIHVVLAPNAVPMFTDMIENEPHRHQVTISAQKSPIGMGDAVFGAREYWQPFDSIIIVWGDQVNLSSGTIKSVGEHSRRDRTIVLPLAKCPDPYVQYDLKDNRIVSVRSAREGDEMDQVGAADIGIFGLSVPQLAAAWDDYMAQASTGNLTGEINFVPFLPFLSSKHNWSVSAIDIDDLAEARGVNTLEDLNFAKERYAKLHIQ